MSRQRVRTLLVNGLPFWGGGEVWFLRSALALRERGHDVTLAADPAGELARRARAAGLAVVSHRRPAAPPAGDAPRAALCNMRRDVVALFRAAGRDAPPAALVRGIDRPLRDGPLRRRTWRRLARILVNSDATGATVRRSLPWFPPERVVRIYNAVELDVEPRVPSPDGAFRIGVVGRLVRSKAVDVLLRAVTRLPADLDWRLTVAGDGDRRARLERLAARLSIAERVRFLGRVDDVAAVYAELDVLAVPSLYEGFCFVAAEAALAGVPVVASRTGGLAEVVVDRRSGILVPPGDPAPLAAGLAALAADPAAAERMGREGRLLARDRFAPDRVHDALDAFVRDLSASS